jgi:aminopeptidase N
MKTYLLTFLSMVILSASLPAQDKTVTYYVDPSATPPDLMISLKHLDARIRFKPAENLVIGSTEFTFVPNRYSTDSIVFNTPDFTVKSVALEGKAASFRLQANNLIIYPASPALSRGKEYKLKIEYEAKPMTGAIYFVGWRPEEAGKRKEIWAHRPSGWIPYMDGRITVDMYIMFDRKYNVFSNGEAVEKWDDKDSTITWHYRMTKTHPFFSTALVIGDYDYETSRSANGVPLEFWYYRGMKDRVHPTYQYTEAMMDFLEKETGFSYPYPVYRQAPVIDYMYGAMETTTSTIFGDFMLIDPHAFWQRNYINTNAHEMAHQWFGNCISHQENKDVWLTESFATYYGKMFERSVFGEDYFESGKNDELNLALTAAKNNNFPVDGTMGGNARIYQKGSLVLGMLRYVMGDKEFHDAINYYVVHNAFKNAETGNFMRAVYEASGKPYNWFFEEWVLHGGEPEYKVSFSVSDDTNGIRSTHINVYQVQEINDQVGLFKMPINFEVHYKDGTTNNKTVWIENKYHEVIIPDPGKKRIDFVLFDPGREIVKKVRFDKSFEELAAQAVKATHMIDRYDALVALRSSSIETKRDLLIRCFSKEHFFLTKAEILDQLSDDINEQSVSLFKIALHDPDANVRKEALKMLSPVPLVLENDVIGMLSDSSYLNVELALQDLCRSFPMETEDILALTANSTGWRGMNIRMKWLEIAIGSGKKEFLPELIGYTGPGFEFETRMNSLNVLKKLNYANDTIIKNAVSAYLHWNNKLSGAGKDVLVYFGLQDQYRPLIRDVISSGTWTTREQNLLNSLLSSFAN